MSAGFGKRPIDFFEFINLAIVSGAFASAFKDLNAQDFMEGQTISMVNELMRTLIKIQEYSLCLAIPALSGLRQL
ncbi:hypothetical protein [Bifidobacterium polysaccharolyticum]|uniref:hypothetical protein n=1 Tax=Bifidobacterium polysaccharolyticum TaxID=2750967 RepID=UPI0018DBB985|nr:hypothetical protein [Bifidobacterium polysaccharolyticum]MBI0063811.1 hypothetical protein [Bifidobacterium polysaccharolyticum]